MNTSQRVQAGPAIELASEQDFQLGALKVFPAAREVSFAQHKVTVEPRVMQVLIRLAKADGAVVSRDDLVQSCWGGRVIGDDAINRCIAKVRQISGLGEPSSFTIDTIPRVGYRLRVEGSPAVESGSEPAFHPAPRRTSRPLWIAGIIAVGAAFLALALWQPWRQAAWHVVDAKSYVRSPPMVRHPAFSPDGKMIAYAQGPDDRSLQIVVRNLQGGTGIQLTHDGFNHLSPTWSSDGAHIAFIATEKNAPCRIMIATLLEGTPREVGRCNGSGWQTLSWQPNSDNIYYSDEEPGRAKLTAIYRLDINTGAARRVTDGGSDIVPQVSPDGRWLAYIRANGETPSQLRIRDLNSGKERVLASDYSIRTDTWTADSKTVLATLSNVGAGEIRAYPADGGKSYRIYSSPAYLDRISASSTGLLAVSTDNSEFALARVKPDPDSRPEIVEQGGSWNASPAYAADGTLAFVSNRSGQQTIWTVRPGADPVPLLSDTAGFVGRLRWSPNGKYLAYVTLGDRKASIHVITSSGTAIMTSDQYGPGVGSPTWTADSQGLLVYDTGDKRTWRISVANPSHRTMVAGPHWVGVTSYADGIYAARDDKPGLWRIDHGAQLIATDYPQSRDDQIHFLDGQVLVPVALDGRVELRLDAVPLAGGPRHTLGYIHDAEHDDTLGIDPHGDGIVYVTCTLHSSEISLLRIARS